MQRDVMWVVSWSLFLDGVKVEFFLTSVQHAPTASILFSKDEGFFGFARKKNNFRNNFL